MQERRDWRVEKRGVTQIDLVVSDALQKIENAVCAAFPLNKCSNGRNKNNIYKENSSMEIQEKQRRNINNKRRKEI